MLIYEVSLLVSKRQSEEFAEWLPDHVKKVLKTPGFVEARICRNKGPLESSEHMQWIVQYKVETEGALDSYLQSRALQLRQETMQKFGESISTIRRVFYLDQIISMHKE